MGFEIIEYLGRKWVVMTLSQFVAINEAEMALASLPIGFSCVSVDRLEWDI